MRGSVLVVIALAFGIASMVPDSATARTGGASSSARGTSGGIHGRALHGRPALPRRAVTRPGKVHRAAVDKRPRAFFWSSDWGDPGSSGSGLVGSGCRVERRQINDDYGWRVRDVTVCPNGATP